MTARKKVPLVAICGRPNVGKSTLFNRLTKRPSAIVHKVEGVTRDRAYGDAEWHGRKFRVVDTGGIVESPTDPVTQKMQEQVKAALNEARVIVFVVDGQQEITRVDQDLRDELFRLGKTVILAVNKLDNERLNTNANEFYALGVGDPVSISSTHGLGIDALTEAIIAALPSVEPESPETEADTEAEPEAETVAEAITKVAVVGKPNVGKSSFINAILNEERAIVDDQPGTTRDAIDVEFHWNNRDYLFIDTAGMRRKAGIEGDLERFSVSRSLRAVRRADVVLMMMDATDGISEQDKRILHYINEQGSASVLVWTKWDLIEDKETRLKEIDLEIERKAPFLKYVPQITISNVSRQRLFKVFELIDKVAEAATRRVSTGALNRAMDAIRATPTPAIHKGKLAKILYATQASVKPTTFVLFVNQKRLFHFSYLRFIENRLREHFDFEGVPIQIELREGEPREPRR